MPAADPSTTTLPTAPGKGDSVAASYLSLVLGKDSEADSTAFQDDTEKPAICDICEHPLHSSDSTVPHEASISHQLCVQHTQPPSHIDRQRKGYTYLQAYGWDADSRLGLGMTGEGRLYPVKAKEKRDTLGLGVEALSPKEKVKIMEKPKRLDAGKVRKMEAEDKKKRERLQRMFYANEDVERYLSGFG